MNNLSPLEFTILIFFKILTYVHICSLLRKISLSATIHLKI